MPALEILIVITALLTAHMVRKVPEEYLKEAHGIFVGLLLSSLVWEVIVWIYCVLS